MIDNLEAVQGHVDDKKKGITFNMIIDSPISDVITARVYYLGGPEVSTPSGINAPGFTAYGGKKGEERTVHCNFSELSPNDNYTIKFTTSSGVVAKAGLVIFDVDAFSTVTIPTPSAPIVEYQPLSARLTEIAALSPDKNRVIMGRNDGTEWEGVSGAALRYRLGDDPVRSTVTSSFTLGDSTVYTFNGTAEADWNLPAPQNGGFYFITNNSDQNLYMNSNTPGDILDGDRHYIGPEESRIAWSDNLNWILK